MEHILVIDDDVDLCALISEYLEPEGFDLEIIHSGEQGLERALTGLHAMVVLDVMLPGISGFEVLRRIRAKSQIPVLMLTARGHDVDRIVGLEIGADDYLPKPFNPRELVARMRAILRRTRKGAQLVMDEVPVETIRLADVEIDLGGRIVRKNGESLFMTTAEFEIVVCLLRSAGKVVTREELSEAALGRRFNPLDRSIDVHVSNIRRKLGNFEDGTERIKSIRGVGYLYAHSATL